MAKAKAAAHAEPKTVGMPVPNEVMAQQAQTVEIASAATQVMFGTMRAMNEEMMSFVRGRFDANVERGREIAACQEPGEVFEVNVNFGRSATEEYLKTVQRIFDLTAQMFDESWSVLREQAPQTDSTEKKTGA